MAFIHRLAQPKDNLDLFGQFKFNGGSSVASTFPSSATLLGLYLWDISN